MRLALILAALCLPPFAGPARAAASYDSCTGTIASLPAVISTQGTWCLKGDLATALTAGDVIKVTVSNVTIDCNGFKLGNLAAGVDTKTNGIATPGAANVTVRGCNLRGFYNAVYLWGYGHIVEDNRIEASRNSAVRTIGDGMIVRRNLIVDTGGANLSPNPIYFSGSADIRDNIVDGLFPIDNDLAPFVYAVYGASQAHYVIRGNVFRGITALDDAGQLFGLFLSGGEGDVIDNTFDVDDGGPQVQTYAIYCVDQEGFIRDNRAGGFDLFSYGCPPEGAGNELR